jgi:hypothetical protein
MQDKHLLILLIVCLMVMVPTTTYVIISIDTDHDPVNMIGLVMFGLIYGIVLGGILALIIYVTYESIVWCCGRYKHPNSRPLLDMNLPYQTL